MDMVFIDDGYTQDGYIAEVAGIHGPLEFTFRPMLVETRDKLDRGFLQGSADSHKAAREEIARRLVKWSLDKEHSAANIGRLRPPVFDKLYAIVSGRIASDLKSDAQAHQVESTPADQEAALKNS